MQSILFAHTGTPILFCKIKLSLCYQAEQLAECRLAGRCNFAQYQQISDRSLFNLKPELRTSTTVEFSPGYPIEIQVTLKPEYLADLAAHATSAETATSYLLQLSQETPDHPLLHTENWLALSVQQHQDSIEVGYTTLWATLNPAAIAAGTLSEAETTEALTQFFSNWTEANLGTLTKKATTQILDEVGNLFNDLADINSSDRIRQR